MESRKIKILAIDDIQDNLISLKALIKEAFPEAIVFMALTGQKGLELAASESPDVILLDVIMPGMDGFEVCRRLKADLELSEIPVVFVTSIKGDKENRITALEIGAEAFLAKPIDESELTAQIRAMLKIRDANIQKRDENDRLTALIEAKTSELKKSYHFTMNLLEDLRKENEARKRSQIALSKSEEKYRRLFEAAKDGILIIDAESGRIIDANPFLLEVLGYSREHFVHKPIWEITSFNHIVPTPEAFMELRKNGYVRYENIPLQTSNESEIAIEFVSNLYLVEEQELIQCNIRDITDRVKAENELLYLSYHDQLTGLYNRRFFEEELIKLDTKSNLPLSIVIGDIDGLKLINDSFGHAAGDELLQKSADIIKRGCRKQDIIARLGGDEFVIILPGADTSVTTEVINRIYDLASNIKIANVDLSISFGFETKETPEQAVAEILANAENHMYRHKLYAKSSMRSKTIDIIMNTLFEKSRRESMHSKRVSEICEAIALKMNLEKDQVNQIIMAGLVHDIGKIGVDEKILNKAGSLCDFERKEIEKHPETGWRILSSTNEFSELAKFILEHHEKWDGTGYPKGLKGNDISIVARIITIADSYDAMTSERCYRKGLSEEEAINEIKRCSGTQFDPEIAKVFVEKVLEKEWSN